MAKNPAFRVAKRRLEPLMSILADGRLAKCRRTNTLVFLSIADRRRQSTDGPRGSETDYDHYNTGRCRHQLTPRLARIHKWSLISISSTRAH